MTCGRTWPCKSVSSSPSKLRCCTESRRAFRVSRQKPQKRGVRTITARGAAHGSSEGRAVLVCPGFLMGSSSYEGLAATLTSKGYVTEIVPVRVQDWFPTTFGGASLQFYVDRMDAALQRLYALHGRVALVGHSAGGWVPRILLGDQPYEGKMYGRRDMVHTLVTLGTPHQSLEQYPFGRVKERLSGDNLKGAPPEVRGSSLKFANYFYPRGDCFEGVRVVCVVGDAIRGRSLWGPGSGAALGHGPGWAGGFGLSFGSLGSSSTWSSGYAGGSAVSDCSSDEDEFGRWEAAQRQPSRLEQYLAFESYKCVCARGDVDGDGVTPIRIAHLPGACNLVLPGVWHIPRSDPAKPWYGDLAAVDEWAQHLEPIGTTWARDGAGRGVPSR